MQKEPPLFGRGRDSGGGHDRADGGSERRLSSHDEQDCLRGTDDGGKYDGACSTGADVADAESVRDKSVYGTGKEHVVDDPTYLQTDCCSPEYQNECLWPSMNKRSETGLHD